MTPLAAIRFDGGDIDGLVAQVAQTLRHRGVLLRGVLQTRPAGPDSCRCPAMDLHDIGTGRVFRISQPLGNGAQGCRLDAGALAACALHLEGEVARGADLLILNRFGRGDSEGRGLRDVMAAALAAGIPVLTALRPAYADAFAAFGGDLACELAMDAAVVLDWFAAVHPARDAA